MKNINPLYYVFTIEVLSVIIILITIFESEGEIIIPLIIITCAILIYILVFALGKDVSQGASKIIRKYKNNEERKNVLKELLSVGTIKVRGNDFLNYKKRLKKSLNYKLGKIYNMKMLYKEFLKSISKDNYDLNEYNPFTEADRNRCERLISELESFEKWINFLWHEFIEKEE